ncbi:helix-turn-helix domain-containing protein [Mycoplasma sp. P36-A1]|uniref:helix-turn-helix domain-containing protein n=1 Tax=Mycoplasma sp. P36-A1 TaxID=3252900 RepID=UPI003C2E063F
MIRNVYISTDNEEKITKLISFLKKNNKYISNIEHLENELVLIQEDVTKYEQLFDYKPIFKQFANDIRTDLSFLIVNDGIFEHIEKFAKTFLDNTYCNVYDASSLIYYCFVTNQYDDIIEEFYSYFSKLDDELLESIYTYLDNNLNGQKTSKDLFLHRNTLNYRLNKFCFRTGIDVRITQSASLIHSYRIRHRNRFIKNYESEHFYIY